MVGIEVILFATAVGELVLVVSHYRRGWAAGLNLWAALEEGLAVLLPRKAARIAALEPHLWVCVLRWISRRTVTPDREFSYHKRSQMDLILVMVAFTTPVELLVLELRAPRVWLRISVLVLGVYALLWIFGLYAPPGHAPPPPRRERPAGALRRAGRGLRASLRIAARPSSAPSVRRSDRATVFRRIPKTAGSTWPWAAKRTSP